MRLLRIGSSLARSLRRVFVVCLLIGAIRPALALNVNESALKGLSQAYGYLYGQAHTLQTFVRRYPELSLQAEVAEREFSASFPGVQTLLRAELLKALGEERIAKFESRIKREIQFTLDRQRLSRDGAVEFIGEVRRRAKGAIDSPVLEFLLAVTFQKAPVREFSNGFRQRYETDGTGKSRGLIVRLQLPRSWLAKEGERPHIVQKWVSQHGTGLEMLMLDIREGATPDPGRAEVDEFVRSGAVREVVPDGGTYYDAGTFTIERRPGYWVDMLHEQERATSTIRQRLRMYQFFFRGKAITLWCSAAGSASDIGRVDEAFERVKPLCGQVLNSIVLPQAY